MSDADPADRLEQEIPADAEEEDIHLPSLDEVDAEAPEADVIEQALPADVDPEDEHR